MKRKAFVRVMTLLGGFTLLGMAAFIAVMSLLNLNSLKNPLLAAVVVVAVLMLLLMGGSVVWLAGSLKARNKGNFVLQKGENGTIGVSLHAIEKQVYACIGKHDLIQKADVAIDQGRDGLIIQLQVDQVAGVNIPLSVGLLQRQIRQYVTACSGVDVQEVRVMVENGTDETVESPYVVQDVVMAEAQRELSAKPVPAAPAAVAEEEEPAEDEEESFEAMPQVVLPPLPAMPEYEEEDDRPLHQRLFGAEEEPVIVPAPPMMAAEEEPEEPEASVDAVTEDIAADEEEERSEEEVLSTLF